MKNYYSLGELNGLVVILKNIEQGTIVSDDIRSWLEVRCKELGLGKTVQEELDKIKTLTRTLVTMIHTEILSMEQPLVEPSIQKYPVSLICERLGISRSTMKNWIDKGSFPHIIVQSERIKFITENDLIEFFSRNKKYRIRFNNLKP